MLRNVFIIILFCFSLSTAHGRLIDKMVAVFNSQVITLSQIRRVNENLTARRNISPGVYTKSKYNDAEISELIINRYLIREKLSEVGYVISDDQVESQIKSTEKRLRLNRKALLEFLRGNNMTFDEYFEIIRETIEFNIFYSRVIRPLISITEQEIKNYYYKKNINNKTIAFRYNLIDFSMKQSKMNSKMVSSFKNMLRKFQTNGVLPSQYSSLQTNELGDITEEGLTKDLKNLLKRTDEGTFTNPIKMNSDYHVFFIKKKDLVASTNYQKARLQIREQLFQSTATKVTSLWFKREKNKHYINFFF